MKTKKLDGYGEYKSRMERRAELESDETISDEHINLIEDTLLGDSTVRTDFELINALKAKKSK